MRKIEQEMLNAIREGRNWQSGNTQVTFSEAQVLGVGAVYLHGNPIALLFSDGGIRLHPNTFCKWPTMTTASRLRALGLPAHIKNGKAHINGKEVRA